MNIKYICVMHMFIIYNNMIYNLCIHMKCVSMLEKLFSNIYYIYEFSRIKNPIVWKPHILDTLY